MPFDGTGNYSPPAPPTFPAVNGEVIRSDYFNAIITDIANSLTLTFTKDGQSAPTAELDFNAQNLTNIDALDATSVDALNYFINGDLLDYTPFTIDFVSATDAADARSKLGVVSGTAWGSITGTLSSQLDLQAALDAKVDDSQISAFGLTLIANANAADARTDLGLATVASSGSAADLSGNLAVARLNSGTNASASTYWRGDGIWTAPSIEGPIDIPTVASLTWVNQGTSTASDGFDAIAIAYDNDDEVHMLVETAPSAPFDIYYKAEVTILSSAAVTTQIYSQAGVVLRDSSDGEFIKIQLTEQRVSGDEQNVYFVQLERWTSATVNNAVVWTRYQPKPFKWLKVNVTSTTITPYVSADGKNWHQAGPAETISTFVDAVDQVGIGFRSTTNNSNTYLDVSYFSDVSPY